VATAWTYFPENKVVQKSQEYVMTGLIVILTLVVLTGILKLIFQAFVPRENLNDCHQTWPDNDEDPCHGFHRQSGNTDNAQYINAYESDESPVYPTMEVESSGQKSEIIGQKEQEDLMPDLHNRTNGLSVHKDSGVNTNIKSKAYIQPETNSDVCTQMNKVAFGNSTSEYPVRRTFAGTSGDVWNECIRYFENISELNNWNKEKSRRVLLSTLRGQAETYAYGMPLIIQRDFDRLKQKMEERFGHTAMKEKYVTEAKLRKRQPSESLRDFGQAIEDLYRRAYPSNSEIVEENAIKSFLDKCGQSEDFRLAVKRMRPKTLQEAVHYALQEECLRAGEKDLAKETRPIPRQIYEIDAHDKEKASTSETTTYGFTRYSENNDLKNAGIYNRSGIGSQRRPYFRGGSRGRGRSPFIGNRPQSFRTKEGVRGDSEDRHLN